MPLCIIEYMFYFVKGQFFLTTKILPQRGIYRRGRRERGEEHFLGVGFYRRGEFTAEVAESAEKSILGRKNLPQSAMDDWHAS
jgi:hypothetical protein